MGTFWLFLDCAFFYSVGVCSALFLEEYKIKGMLGKIIEVNVSNLAGVPSIVYGLLGLTVFVRFLGFDRSLLSGSLTLALLILPVIIVSSRHAIRAVPQSIRHAAHALGVSQYHVVFGQVFPMALPGIMTGIILSLSRAIGETAPLIIVGDLTYVSYTPESPMDEFTVLPLQIYNWRCSRGEFSFISAGGIIVLLVVMMSMNLLYVLIRHKFEKRM